MHPLTLLTPSKRNFNDILRDSFTFVFDIHDFLLLFVAVEYRSAVENRFSPMKNCLMSFYIERARGKEEGESYQN